jgi:hypothetical protein
MFDIQATIKWVTAVLTDPNAAAASYRATPASWQQSFLQITLPLYVVAFSVGGLVAAITGGSFLYAGFTLTFFLFSLLWAMAWTFVIAFIFDYVGGMFDTERNFDRAYALVALAIVPAALGNALGSLPWLGWLLSLALGIYSLMLAYRFIPVFLELAEASRVKHFAISIIAALVVNVIVTMTLGAMFLPSVMQNLDYSSDSGSRTSGETSAPTGFLGALERQVELADAAAQDIYDPPSDGRLKEDQVEFLADTLLKTKRLRERLGKKFEKFDEDKTDKEPSLTDIFSGVGDAARMTTAEMEVVKSAGGNWAEHQWVRGQIEIARIQQDLNEETRHNYALFLKYQESIEENE